MATQSNTEIENQIVTILEHPEAEEGLYLGNFSVLHEEDERPVLQAPQEVILDALKSLISQGKVRANTEDEDVIFCLVKE